jgi:gamma-glutamyl hercynylcysteine S-oxide synthase
MSLSRLEANGVPMSSITLERSATLASAIATALAEARERTLTLVRPVSDADLRLQHDPLMSPIIWDLGHIAAFEELWLTRNLDGVIEFSEMPGLFNPFEHPRRVRGALVLPSLHDVIDTTEDIRRRVLALLHQVDLASHNPLLHDGYVYRMVLQHEYQHDETILQTLQLKQGEAYRAPRAWSPPPASLRLTPGDMVRFSGGEVVIGTHDRSAAYDNERPAHTVAVKPFAIDVTPVTNGQFVQFIDAGGYGDPRWWSDAGRRWLEESGCQAPKHWRSSGAGWTVRVMDRESVIDPQRPVCHVCYHEAEAFARWAGKRLPTEIEWEVAASWDASAGRRLDFPWGSEPASHLLANVDQLAFDTAPIGSYPRNVSPLGCYGMIGDVWEWTSSDFAAWPGFTAYPYAEYSQVFFGNEYKVLRGGSWATRPGAIRNSFRNWDYPIRRQIFSGFRCAADD